MIKLYEENCEILINKKLVIETGWCGASCIVLLKVFRKNRSNRMCTYAFIMKIYYKEWDRMIMKAGEPKILSVSPRPGDPIQQIGHITSKDSLLESS